MLNLIADAIQKTRGDWQRIDDARAAANASIARLQEIGTPQAQRWAQMLNDDPRRGLIAAQQYGGIGEVENSLRSSVARANAARQQQALMARSGMDPLETLAFMTDGASGYKAVRDANAAPKRESKADAAGFLRYTDTGERVFPGVEKPATPEDIERQALGGVSGAELDKRLAAWEKQHAEYQDIGLVRKQVESAENSALGAITLVNRLQQQIDPGAVVREGDVALITGGLLSGSDRKWNDLVKWIDQNAGANVVVPELKRVLMSMMDDKEDEYAVKVADMYEYADRNGWTDKAKNRGFAYIANAERAIENSRRRAEENSASRDEYEQATAVLRAQGIPDDKITAALVADVMEQMDALSGHPAASGPPTAALTPLQALGAQASRGQRPATLQDLQALMANRGG